MMMSALIIMSARPSPVIVSMPVAGEAGTWIGVLVRRAG